MGKNGGRAKHETLRGVDVGWPALPKRATPKSWNLFLACGKAMAVAYDEDRHPMHEDEDSGSILRLLDEDKPKPLPGSTPDADSDGSGRSEREANLDDRERLHAAFRGRHRRPQQPKDVVNKAFLLLTRSPLDHFPFLSTPGSPRMPRGAALLVALLCARYVLDGEFEPFCELRWVLWLLESLPDRWPSLGRPLLDYCRKKHALLDFLVADGAPTAMDGAVMLSSEAFRSLLDVEIPEDPPWHHSGFSARRGRFGRTFLSFDRSTANRKRERTEAPRMVTLVKPLLRREDVVLPPDLSERLDMVVALCRKRPDSAPTLLFHGAPGTGKTHGAHVFAGALTRKLATTSLAQISDKYVGETEKHLARMFGEAKEEGAVLLMDEADALLQGRQYSTLPWRVSWVNTLLKLLENPGVPVILCTNFIDRLDPALHRRIHYVFAFPVPGPEERKAIWARELRLAGFRAAVDLNALAGVPLSGGLIANAVHQARVRRNLLGRRFRTTTEALLKLAVDELPKMACAERRPEKHIGFRESSDE